MAETSGKSKRDDGLLRVGELAKAVGKTVRAMHLYEELGLLRPATRTDGGFRLYAPEAVARIAWIIKLQAIGFKLSDIQGFVQEFEHSASGREATGRVREVFQNKLASVRAQIDQLRGIETDLTEALEYLETCQECSPSLAPVECDTCGQHDTQDDAPTLFAGLSRTAAEEFDVSVSKLRKGSGGAQ